MTWTQQFPTAPGRYWWRHTDSYGRMSYGLALIAWQPRYSPLSTSDLHVRSTLIMGNRYGNDERELGGSWAYGGDVSEGTEYWSEPLNGPLGLLPTEMPARPPDPTPDEIREHKAREAARAKLNRRRDKRLQMQRAKRIDAAVASNTTLYLCTECEALIESDGLTACRECPSCSTQFVSDDRECPDCNRPFSRTEHKLACPECESTEECVLLVDHGQVIRTDTETP